MAEKKFTVYRTMHGPVVRESNGKWVSIRLMQEPVKALMQSYLRTKAQGLRCVSQDHGVASEFLEQHDFRGCRWRYRLFSRQLYTPPRSEFRLDEAGGRRQSSD